MISFTENHKKLNLPMVLYYKKLAAQKTRVERSAKAEWNHPVVTQKLFDYTGPIQNWNFTFTDKHPIQMDWSKPAPFLKPADNAQQNTATQQSNDANQAAPSQTQQTQQQPAQQTQQSYQQPQQQQAAYPTQQQNTYQSQTAAQQPAAAPAPAAQAAQPAQPAAEQQQQTPQQQQDVPAFRIPANAFKLGKAAKSQ